MRLLLDENLSPALSRFLIEAGHDVVHVRDRGLTSATDDVVLALAAAEGRVLISADTDFGTLLARSGATEPSVVLIRRAVGRRAAEQARLLIANLPVAKDDLEDGAVVVLGEKTLRIRRLPI
jgi:predicted nuclease of predicted toxin-antitoxin system